MCVYTHIESSCDDIIYIPMPQLDKVTFLTQYVWLCLTFFAMYLVLVKVFLPAFARIAQVRPAVALSQNFESESRANITDIRGTHLQSSLAEFETYSTAFLTWQRKLFQNLGNATLSAFAKAYKDIASTLLLTQTAVRRSVTPTSWLHTMAFDSPESKTWFTGKKIRKNTKVKLLADKKPKELPWTLQMYYGEAEPKKSPSKK